jgi:hypothetical protein
MTFNGMARSPTQESNYQVLDLGTTIHMRLPMSPRRLELRYLLSKGAITSRSHH